jgi:hypothetical protein
MDALADLALFFTKKTTPIAHVRREAGHLDSGAACSKN